MYLFIFIYLRVPHWQYIHILKLSSRPGTGAPDGGNVYVIIYLFILQYFLFIYYLFTRLRPLLGHLQDEFPKTTTKLEQVIIGNLLRQGQGHREVQREAVVLLLVVADTHGPRGGAVWPFNIAKDAPRSPISPRAPETGELATHDFVSGDIDGIFFRDPVFS